MGDYGNFLVTTAIKRSFSGAALCLQPISPQNGQQPLATTVRHQEEVLVALV